MWRATSLRELREPLEEACQKAEAPCEAQLVPEVYLPRGARPKVLVYTGCTIPTLTDCNDGAALLSMILPDDCQIELCQCRPLEFRALGRYDLLILGLGDFFHEPILRQPGLVRFQEIQQVLTS